MMLALAGAETAILAIVLAVLGIFALYLLCLVIHAIAPSQETTPSQEQATQVVSPNAKQPSKEKREYGMAIFCGFHALGCVIVIVSFPVTIIILGFPAWFLAYMTYTSIFPTSLEETQSESGSSNVIEGE